MKTSTRPRYEEKLVEGRQHNRIKYLYVFLFVPSAFIVMHEATTFLYLWYRAAFKFLFK